MYHISLTIFKRYTFNFTSFLLHCKQLNYSLYYILIIIHITHLPYTIQHTIYLHNKTQMLIYLLQYLKTTLYLPTQTTYKNATNSSSPIVTFNTVTITVLIIHTNYVDLFIGLIYKLDIKNDY